MTIAVLSIIALFAVDLYGWPAHVGR